jgi:hypothetical protein
MGPIIPLWKAVCHAPTGISKKSKE